MADQKVIQKIDLSLQKNSSKCTTLAGQQTGQPRQCTPPSQALERQFSSALYHHKCTGDNKALGSSAQLTTGDVGSNEVMKKPRTSTH